MAHMLLVVPVPELDDLVRPRLASTTPELLRATDDEPVAHIALLNPFGTGEDPTPGVVAELRRLFGDVTPFPFKLTRVSRFPGGAAYLTPEPAAPFRALTLQLGRRFPEYPLAESLEHVVPHLTVPLLPGEDVDDVEAALAERLPVEAYANGAALIRVAGETRDTVERFSFGTSAA